LFDTFIYDAATLHYTGKTHESTTLTMLKFYFIYM